jgi:hypothetical protein
MELAEIRSRVRTIDNLVSVMHTAVHLNPANEEASNQLIRDVAPVLLAKAWELAREVGMVLEASRYTDPTTEFTNYTHNTEVIERLTAERRGYGEGTLT